MDTSRLRAYVQLKNEKKELDARLKQVNGELEQMLDPLIDMFMDAGVTNMKIDGQTVYISRTLWAGMWKDEDGNPHPKISIPAFKLSPLTADLVKESINLISLSAAIRELPNREDGSVDLPPELEGKISIAVKPDLRVRKAAS